MGTVSPPFDDTFDELSWAYHHRLQEDVTRLLAFRAELVAQPGETCHYENLRAAAHQMAGAAAIFKAAGIMTAAIRVAEIAGCGRETAPGADAEILGLLDVFIASIFEFYSGYHASPV